MILLVAMLIAQQVTPELRAAVEAGLKAKQAGDLAAAAKEFRKVVELAPQMAAAHANLGAVLHDKGDYGEAIPALRRALELNPQLPGTQLMLGTALLAQGWVAEAIPHFEKTQTVDMLGIALVEAGREREGIDRLEAALASRPGDPDLLYYLGRAHAALARNALAQAGAVEGPRKYQLQSEIDTAAGRREAAAQGYRKALELRPALRGAHYALGELALESGDYETAAREFAAEAALAPGSAAAAYKLGTVLANRGDRAGALRELRRASGLKPDMPETLLELGKSELAAGNAAAAEAMWKRVVELEGSTALAANAHFQLAQLYRQTKRPAEAERETKLFQELRKAAGK